MTETTRVIPITARQTDPTSPRRPAGHDDANRTMNDAVYVAYVLSQMFKLGAKLLSKRWPELG